MTGKRRTKGTGLKLYALRVDEETAKVLEDLKAEGADLATVLRELMREALPGLEMMHAAMVAKRMGNPFDEDKWIMKAVRKMMEQG